MNSEIPAPKEKDTFEKYLEILQRVGSTTQFPFVYTGPYFIECNELIGDNHLLGAPTRDISGEITAIAISAMTVEGREHLERLRKQYPASPAEQP